MPEVQEYHAAPKGGGPSDESARRRDTRGSASSNDTRHNCSADDQKGSHLGHGLVSVGALVNHPLRRYAGALLEPASARQHARHFCAYSRAKVSRDQPIRATNICSCETCRKKTQVPTQRCNSRSSPSESSDSIADSKNPGRLGCRCLFRVSYR